MRWKLSDPRNPYVIDALTRLCPYCAAQKGARCTNVGGKFIKSRLVHYARVIFPPAATELTLQMEEVYGDETGG